MTPRSWPVMPGVPAAGHVAGGAWHPGAAAGCSRCAPAAPSRHVPPYDYPGGGFAHRHGGPAVLEHQHLGAAVPHVHDPQDGRHVLVQAGDTITYRSPAGGRELRAAVEAAGPLTIRVRRAGHRFQVSWGLVLSWTPKEESQDA